MTFGELQEISVRQQRELEAQQKILLTKEQRLKFLRNRDAQHLQIAEENERLRKLRERVESQELKLKKLRALRGQAEQQKLNNGNLSAELDAIKALFNEKEKELSIAVAKVDHLTQQLDQLRLGKWNTNGKVNTDHPNTLAAIELEKLKKKLALRNTLNEQQNLKMTQQRDTLLRRRKEVNLMDKRISELQQRLKKRMSQQIQNNKQNEQNRANKLNHVRQGSNIAAIEPYHHAPRQNASIDETHSDQNFNKDNPKYQSLPGNTKIPANGSNVPENEKISNSLVSNKSVNDTDYKTSLVVSVDKYSGFNSPTDPSQGTFKSKEANQMSPSSNGESVFRFPSTVQNRSAIGIANFVPKPFGSTYSTSMLSGRGPNTYPTPATPEEVRQDGSGQSSPATSENSNSVLMPQQQQQQQHPASPSMYSGKTSASQLSNGNGNNNFVSTSNVNIKIQSGHTVAVKNLNSQQTDITGQKSGQNWAKTGSVGPFVNTYKAQAQVSPVDTVDHRSAVPLPQKENPENGTDQLTHSSKNHVNISNLGEDYIAPSRESLPHPTNTSSSKVRFASGNTVENIYMNKLGNDTREVYQRHIVAIYSSGEPFGRDLHPGAKAEIKQPSKEQQQNIPERPTAHEAERPHAMSSFHSKTKHMTAPLGVNPQQRDLASDKGSFKAHTPKNIRRRHSDIEEDVSRFIRRSGDQPRSVSTSSISYVSQHPTDTSGYGSSNGSRQWRNKANQHQENSEYSPNGVSSSYSSNKEGRYSNQEFVGEVPKKSLTSKLPGKSLLKITGSKKHSRRVTFDPLALLLDASLEGELGLVMKTAQEVANVSASNDEGITALHNAICAGHYDIVKFLIEFGCDVNAPDSDGWTPLHCAASCNNLPMVQLLVNHGACIFATTVSDQETAAEKCEEDEDGYDGCSEYLYSVQEKLGIVNNGIVYATFDYEAENSDELNFKMGNQLSVLRKGDEQEKEWWWARLHDQEGYVARNLLGLQPRVSPEHSRWLNS